jgi:hypothetical protein
MQGEIRNKSIVDVKGMEFHGHALQPQTVWTGNEVQPQIQRVVT